MSAHFDAGYYERLQDAIRGMLIEFGEHFSTRECELFGTLIDANELGVALEMMIESLESSGAVVGPRAADGLNKAAATMGLEVRFQGPETSSAQTDSS